MMAAGNFFLGAPNRIEQVPRFNQEQQSLLQNLLGLGQQTINNPYKGFEPIAQRATSQFNQQTVPGLAQRFASLGSNSLSSPAFASQLGQAGAGLQEGLAALQSQYGMQNRQQGLQFLQQGLTPQFENIPLKQESGFLQESLPSLAKLGARTGSAYYTGGISEAIKLLMNILGSGNSDQS